MYKSKTKRLRNISVEIAVACNVVFLVLALLISSSKFSIPSKTQYVVAPMLYDGENEATIFIAKNKVMFQIPDGLKDATLSQIEELYNFKLSAQQREAFKNTSVICVPIAELKNYLDTYNYSRKSPWLNRGIRCDTVTNELFNWVREARKADAALNGKALHITIDAEEDAPDSKISEVLNILKRQKVAHLNMRLGSYRFGSCG
ncbi:hypothetical protein BEL04_22110 [Mucilaginibacter sp. PPCGB 2223]|uniref:hypothetical protein n=1 Tax=Mucilaginibacter sp. PPCGB 2223 TaxID=1886027 RepID=UPI000827103A|nr:hypothetical protein [Mucilaginibacter sp. PPCGB 2223]OCX50479.1 hypothetical protein BEL04_22110 [Mucilaginibacter sp. PPCGB 2223]